MAFEKRDMLGENAQGDKGTSLRRGLRTITILGKGAGEKAQEGVSRELGGKLGDYESFTESQWGGL